MNFYDSINNFDGPPINYQHNINPNLMNNNPMILNNNLTYKINELEQRIKKLELRISRLEAEKGNNNYIEPDTSLYMI